MCLRSTTVQGGARGVEMLHYLSQTESFKIESAIFEIALTSESLSYQKLENALVNSHRFDDLDSEVGTQDYMHDPY
jgi:hypothetical protein